LLLPAFLAACVLLTAAPAAADDGILVVPLSGELSGDLAAAPERLTDELVSAAGAAGIDAVRAEISRSELAAVAGCSDSSPECLLQVAETLGAAKILVGAVAAGDEAGTVTVTLTIAGGDGEPAEHSFELSGDSVDELATALRPIATAIFTGKPLPKPKAEPEPEPTPTPEPTPEPTPTPPIVEPPPPHHDGGGFDLGRVKGYSWGIAGGGVALAAVGAVFLGVAEGKQSDVDDAPIQTVSDFEALRDLEDDGKRFNRLGNGLLIVGGAAVIVGAVLIVKQAKSSPERPSVSVAPVPVEGGAGLVITWGLP